MRSALYYPHTTVGNAELVKTALIMWDKLEFIVPWKGFRPHYEDRKIARAMELLGKPRVPNHLEKRETHKAIDELINRPLPPNFYYSHQREPYEMYPQKLLPETWDMLQRSRLTGDVLDNADYPTTEPIGLTIMSILADCCAGKTLSRMTDQGEAYATLAGILGSNYGTAPAQKQPIEQLVPVTLDLIDMEGMSVEKLIEFREREEKEGGHSLRELRHKYVDALETYVKRLATERVSATDAEEIKRQLTDDMEIDLKNLKQELGFARREMIFSKEVLLTVLASVGSAATWLFGASFPILGTVTAAGAPATVGGILGARNKYLSARHSVMQKHPMAYLYELEPRRNAIRAAMRFRR